MARAGQKFTPRSKKRCSSAAGEHRLGVGCSVALRPRRWARPVERSHQPSLWEPTGKATCRRASDNVMAILILLCRTGQRIGDCCWVRETRSSFFLDPSRRIHEYYGRYVVSAELHSEKHFRTINV